MRAISLSCPHCGAKLEAPEAAHKVTCSYCNTQSRIQHRTRYLERKIDLPRPPPQERHLPIAKQRHRIRWLVGVSSFLPLLTAGGVGYFTLQQTGGLSEISAAISEARSAASDAIGRTSDNWSYSGSGSVLFFDVNEDGVEDIIGPVRYVQQDDSYRIAAFDGLAGERLWESEVFGDHSDANQGITALHGEYVVQADSRGNISGYLAKNGGTLWKVSMGEKLSEMCGHAPGLLALGLKDKRWKELTLSDGSFTALDGRPEDCLALNEHEERGRPSHHFTSDTRRGRPPSVKVDGMRVRDALVLSGDDTHTLLLGHKMPGTRVPMLAMASLKDPEVASTKGKRRRKSKPKLSLDWASELPALNPLRVREGEPTLVTMNANLVAAIYSPDDGSPRVVCFSREGGQRLWDRALPKKTTHVLRAIDINKERVFVSQWGRLDAFALDDGRLVFSLGD